MARGQPPIEPTERPTTISRSAPRSIHPRPIPDARNGHGEDCACCTLLHRSLRGHAGAANGPHESLASTTVATLGQGLSVAEVYGQMLQLLAHVKCLATAQRRAQEVT